MPGFVIPHTRRRPDGGPSDTRYWQVRYGVLPQLIKFRPDVVVSIEFGPRSIQAATYCAAFDVPLIIWSEGTPHSEGWQSSLRRFVRRSLVKRACRFWSNGAESSELLLSYGARKETLHEGMIGVDTAHLAGQVRDQLQRRAQIRAELGVAGTVFLFSGQLVSRKGVKEFLAALLPLAKRAQEFSMIFLGDGVLRPMIEEWTGVNPEFHVVILGFRQPSYVPCVYAAADVFVMPTLDDNWSLVALEAAIAGLPQVFSRYNGATADLVRMNAAGAVVDPFDTPAFSGALERLLDGECSRSPSEAAISLANYYGPEACADRALESIDAALGS
jgi:glycosyltransferase involved in cell wall biosynthesis